LSHSDKKRVIELFVWAFPDKELPHARGPGRKSIAGGKREIGIDKNRVILFKAI
jgi:hypothetical protein